MKYLLTYSSMSHATIKLPMPSTRMPGQLSWIHQTPTSKHDCSCFGVVGLLVQTSTMLQFLKTCIHRRIRTGLGFLQDRNGEWEVLQINSHHSRHSRHQGQ